MTKQDILEYFKDINEVYNNPNKHDDLSKMLDTIAQQEPCEDAISRQAAIKAIEALQLPIMREASSCYQFKFSGMSEAREAVENLPSVTPQPKTGTWRKDIDNSRRWDRVRFYCSECGSWQTYGETGFCPNCGAKMESEGGK